MAGTFVDWVYAALPDAWDAYDVRDLRADVRATIRAEEKAAMAAPFTQVAQQAMKRVRHLWDAYDVLGVLAESYPALTIEGAWEVVQQQREECRGE